MNQVNNKEVVTKNTCQQKENGNVEEMDKEEEKGQEEEEEEEDDNEIFFSLKYSSTHKPSQVSLSGVIDSRDFLEFNKDTLLNVCEVNIEEKMKRRISIS